MFHQASGWLAGCLVVGMTNKLVLCKGHSTTGAGAAASCPQTGKWEMDYPVVVPIYHIHNCWTPTRSDTPQGNGMDQPTSAEVIYGPLVDSKSQAEEERVI